MAIVNCPDCGKMISDVAPACIGCGRPTSLIIQKAARNADTAQINIPNDTEFLEVPVRNMEEHSIPTASVPSTPGIKWLKFWNYFSLPVGGLLNALMYAVGFMHAFEKKAGFELSVDTSRLIFLVSLVTWTIPYWIVAWAVHRRKAWAWYGNWVVIILTASGFLYDFHDLAFDNPHPIRFILVGSLWMWANIVYWRKRRHLFERQFTPDKAAWVKWISISLPVAGIITAIAISNYMKRPTPNEIPSQSQIAPPTAPLRATKESGLEAAPAKLVQRKILRTGTIDAYLYVDGSTGYGDRDPTKKISRTWTADVAEYGDGSVGIIDPPNSSASTKK